MSGLFWLLFSPLAALMAFISTVESQLVYYAQVAIFGLWSLLGMGSGVATLLRAWWARRLQRVLLLVAGAYFLFAAIGIASFFFAWLVSGRTPNPTLGWVVTALVSGSAVAIVARSRLKGTQSAQQRDA